MNPWIPPRPPLLIEKGMPIPPRNNAIVAAMEVGDSILASDPEDIRQLRNSWRHLHRTKGWRFKTRTLSDGYRIWRIE